MADARPARAGRVAAGHTSFLSHDGGRYGWVGLALCLISILLYAVHDPVEGKSGSTWLGYTLGTLGALLIAWLAWLGVRKRQLASGRGSMVAWVSAHVYLGLSLLVIGTLHAGFQLGWNVHSLAYLLMLVVIGSGIYGVIAYSVVPARITAGRDQVEFAALVEEFDELNETLLNLADRIDHEIHAVVARSVSRTLIGGSAWQQLSGRYPKPGEHSTLDNLFSARTTQIKEQILTESRLATATSTGAMTGSSATVMFMARNMVSGQAAKRGEDLQKLIQAMAKRNALRQRINQDITLRSRLQAWLFLHVPVTLALLAALLAHVLAVFLYW